MKNVQYYLKKANKKEIAKAYFDKFIFDRILNDKYKKYRKLSFNEYYKLSIKKIITYIDRLCKLNTLNIPDEEKLIIIRYEPFRNEKHYDTAGYRYKDVFSDKKFIEGYAYEFEHQDRIMSYLIADTYFNKMNITDVIIDIMHNASFFGYDSKHDEKVDKLINEIDKNMEEKNCTTISFKKFRKDLGFTNKQISLMDKYDKKLSDYGIKELENRLMRLENKYCKKCLMFQVNEIRNNNLCLLDKV